MLRRAAAGLILGVSLFVASLAWSSFIALRTVLDPARSQQIADDLWEDDAVRGQLADNIATGARALVPDDVQVSEATIQAASRMVLDSPALRSVVNAAFVDTHAALLGEGDLPRAIEVGEISQSVRSALVEVDPFLDEALPAAPDVTIELPTDRIPDASPVRRALQFVVPIFAVIAAVGIAMALLTTTNRPAVLRRAGVWAMTSSAFVLVISWGIPWLARRLAPSQAEVLAAFVDAVLSAAFTPSLVLAGLGLAAVVASFVWKAGQVVRRDDDRMPKPRRAEEPEMARAQRGGATSVMHTPAQPHAPPAHATVPDPDAAPGPVPTPAPAPEPVVEVTPPPTAPAPTAAAPGPAASPAPTRESPPPFAAGAGDGLAPKWIPGVGWVQHPDDERPPEGAHWEPGIGYILDRPADPFDD